MQMLIGGKYVDASDGATIAVVNPVTGKAVDAVPAATLEDLDRGIALAVEGQKEWKEVPLHEKIRILEKYACLIEEEADQIAGVMCEEGENPSASAERKCLPMRLFSEYTAPRHIRFMEKPFRTTGRRGPRGMW